MVCEFSRDRYLQRFLKVTFPSEVKMLVGRLNGFVNALSAMDGEFGDSNSGAYLAPLEFRDLEVSLKTHLSQETAHEYSYSAITRIAKPWSRKLHVALVEFFLQRPFGIVDILGHEQLGRTREALVLRVVDMIGMITDDYSCEDVFCVEISSNDGYSGHMYVFPLSQDFLLLKTISRL